jgi:D-Tyr-tRNAtyr deacylase
VQRKRSLAGGKAFTCALDQRCGAAAERVHDGVFGAMMNVTLENDGPVTFILDSGHQGAGHH